MNVSFQLYSSRNVGDQKEFLKTLADLGYTQVEGFGGIYDEDAPAFRAAMDELGLTMPTGHMALDDLENDFDRVVKLANTFGMTHLFGPFLMPELRPTDADGWRAIGARLQKVQDKARDHGLTIGWHNHEFEFEPLATGEIPMDLILEAGPDVMFEADIAWIIRGGQDPLTYIKKYGDRIVAAHVKDIAPAGENLDEDGWADVGTGTVDWAGLTAALREYAPNARFIMEHDNPSDIARFAKQSIENFRKF